jgi:hypothetical protein
VLAGEGVRVLVGGAPQLLERRGVRARVKARVRLRRGRG